MSFSDCPSSIQLSVVLLRSFHTVLVIVHLASASCSGLFYKLVVLWESSVVTGRRKSSAIDLKGSRRVQLASWRNLILTFRSFDLIRPFVGRSYGRGSYGRSRFGSIDVRCSIVRPFGVVLVPP